MTLACRATTGFDRDKYKCDACGRVDYINERWVEFGSVAHRDICPDDLPHACSSECKNIIDVKIKKGKFSLPKLSMPLGKIDFYVSKKRVGY